MIASGAFLISCKKKQDNPPPSSTPTPAVIGINSDAQVQFQIDNGNLSSYIVNNDLTNVMGTGGSIGSPTSFKDFSSGFHYNSSSVSVIDITKGTISYVGTGKVDSTTFVNYFSPGSYSFSPVTSPTISIPISGIVISWWDSNNIIWKTDVGTGDQTGSSFSILAVKEEEQFGDQLMKVYATFNCKLYDGNGNSKTLTNGKLVCYFGNF